MLRKIFFVIRKVVLAAVLLYTYNSINISVAFVPINFLNLALVTIFGFPAVFCLVLFSFFI